MRLRTEDGAFADSRKLLVNATRWEWARLETGEDALIGPTNLSLVALSVSGRVVAGGVDLVQFGTVS